MKTITNSWFIENKEYSVNLDQIYNEVSKIHQHTRPYYFTDHSITHSERIKDHLINLFPFLFMDGSKEHMLSDVEKFILFAGILLHDIGIALIDPEKIRRLAEKFSDIKLDLPIDNKDINDNFIRDNHHLISKLWVLENASCSLGDDKIELREAYIGIRVLAKYVANVCESHGFNFEESRKHTEITAYGNEKIRMGLLCNLLSLGDALDCDQRRIDYDILKTSVLTVDSRVHWMKHYYVDGIILTPNLIEIFYSFPQNDDIELNELYEEYFVNKTKKWIEKCFTVRRDFLFPLKAICRVVDIVNFTNDKDVLKPDELNLVKKEYIKNLREEEKHINNMISFLEGKS